VLGNRNPSLRDEVLHIEVALSFNVEGEFIGLSSDGGTGRPQCIYTPLGG
jgi:hypothetical protein